MSPFDAMVADAVRRQPVDPGQPGPLTATRISVIRKALVDGPRSARELADIVGRTLRIRFFTSSVPALLGPDIRAGRVEVDRLSTPFRYALADAAIAEKLQRVREAVALLEHNGWTCTPPTP